jgi:hypothetical protein
MAIISAGKLGERVQRIINGGSTKPELKIHKRDAILAVAQARDEAITNLFYEKKSLDEHTFPYDILSTLEVEVKDGEAPLPKRGLSILKHNSGIYRITTACDNPADAEELIPTPIGFNTLYKNLQGITLGGNPSYQPIEDRIQVQGVEDGCKLKIEMVLAGEEFTEDEFFCIPADLQNEVVRIAVQTLMIMSEAEHDVISDSKPNR